MRKISRNEQTKTLNKYAQPSILIDTADNNRYIHFNVHARALVLKSLLYRSFAFGDGILHIAWKRHVLLGLVVAQKVAYPQRG